MTTDNLSLFSAPTLTRMLADVRQKLENSPEFKTYEKINAELDRRSTGRGKHANNTESAAKTERERMIDAAITYSKSVKNKSITMKQLIPVMNGEGIIVRGRYPGTTIGAVVTKSGYYERVPNKKAWKLKSEHYVEA